MSDAGMKPCPFCGGKATIEEVPTVSGANWSVGCSDEDGQCYGYQSLQTFARKCEAVEAWNRRAPLSAFEAAAEIADEYAAENFRMATDSFVLDRAQRLSNTEERQIEGNGHSAAGITARNIAAAIRALALKGTE